jgi:hypothetical protein
MLLTEIEANYTNVVPTSFRRSFNIASYALLTMMIAQVCYEAGELFTPWVMHISTITILNN